MTYIWFICGVVIVAGTVLALCLMRHTDEADE